MGSKQNENLKSYTMIVEFANFLKQNGDKLFEKDCKLCLKTEQIYVLQEYLQQILTNRPSEIDHKYPKRKTTTVQNLANNKEFILLYKSNQLHLIQDFLFKITSLKITSDLVQNASKEYIKLSIFGSLTYLEIKNIPILNIYDLENLRKQLEILITTRSVNKLQDLIHLCGADQSSPLSWPKLHTLNLSYNNLSTLDSSLRLTTSIEVLDLSHNNLKTCELYLHNLPKLKRLNLSFNKLVQIPSLCQTNNVSQLEYLDISYNNIEALDADNILKLTSLKHLNFSNNIISTTSQLNRLRILTSLKEVILDGNPVKLNSNCDQIIREILDIVKAKNNLKKSPQVSSIQWTNYQSRPSQTGLPIKKLSKKPSIPDEHRTNEILSAPNLNSVETYLKSNKGRRRSTARLRPNNILIEQHDDETSDFVMIKKINESDSDQEPTQLSSSLLSNYFQSHTLQSELEYYKTMRQKYGTGWLSVLPNEVKDQSPKLKKNPSLDKIENGANEKELNESDLNILETYVVYRRIDLNQIDQMLNSHNGLESHETNVCIVGLDEKFLVEKDETNSKILAKYEYSNLSEILDLSKLRDLVDDKFESEENKNQIKIKFKDLSSSRIYEFENSNEINSFIECIREILFNKHNLEKCDLYYCVWCKEFGKKSKYNFDESTENLSNEEVHHDDQTYLTCTKCHKYLVKDSQVLSDNIAPLTPRNSREQSPNRSDEITQDDTISQASIAHDLDLHEDITIEQRLKDLMSVSNQISKNKLEEITNRAKKINNNLKLFLIINVLGEMKKNESLDEPEESLLCAYKLKYFFFQVTKLCDECVCVFTNRHLILFQINDLDLFKDNVDFEKCVTKVAVIDINQIEVIEIGIAQNYLVLTVQKSEDSKILYKLVTNDVYLNQALLNTLLKTINESKKVTQLKKIKKTNDVTNNNLEEIVSLVEHIHPNNNDFLLFSSRLNLYLYIEDLQINGPNALMEESTYENLAYAMFLYNNERILLVEENLSYMSTLNKNEQFTLISTSRISDIVQLKLFKEDEKRIEIKIVDEANNSVQINWTIQMNKTFQLSQFISQIKDLWEKIFFIELPINF